MKAPGETRGMISWFARNPVAANLLMVLIIAVGFTTARALPREGFPSLPPNQVTIDVAFPSGSPEIAAEGVVSRIEAALLGAPGLKKVFSVARADGVTISVEKVSRFDLEELLTDIKARVDAIPNLPARSERPVIRKQAFDEHVIWAQVSGQVEPSVLEQVARKIHRDLLREPSIRRVDRLGHRSPEVHIEIDEATLAEYGLTLGEVATAIGRESLTDLSGRLRDERGAMTLRAAQQAVWPVEFAEIPLVAQPDGSSVRLGEIATLQSGFDDGQRVWMRYQGRPSIGLKVFMDRGGSIDAVSNAVRGVLQRWEESGALPPEVALETWNDRSQQITDRISLLLKNALLGVLLVFGILALALDLRVAFWVAMGLPVAFGGAFLLMGERVFALSINELTTFGMIVALGIVVDDAVVVGESVHAARRTAGASISSTIRGVHRVAVPTVFGVLTTVAAFAVLPLVRGEFGQIFAQFATVTAGCLVFSILESKLILPAHLAKVGVSTGPRSRFGAMWVRAQAAVAAGFEQLARRYAELMANILKRRYTALLTIFAISAAILSLYLGGVVHSVFFPEIPSDVLNATLSMEESAGHGLTESNIARIEQALHQTARRLEGGNVGSPLLAAVQTRMTSDRTAELVAELSSRDVRKVSADRLVEEWKREVGGLEGVRALSFSSELESFPALRLELAAASEAELLAAHGKLEAHLLGIDGLENLTDNLSPGRSELQLTLTPEGRARGLRAAYLSGQVQQAFFGDDVQRFQRGTEEVRVRVRYPAEDRRDISDLLHTKIRTPNGDQVPLSAVARFERRTAVSEITHIDGRRVSTFTAGVDKSRTSPEAILRELEESFFPALRAEFPGIQINQAGELAEIAETRSSIFRVLLLALGAIYALVAIPLKSYTQPLLIMSAIPFGILGAILGHWVHGVPLSLLSMFGLLALSGVVVNDSLLLIFAFNEERAMGKGEHEALATAGAGRLRAVLLTSITTFAGLAPLVRETSEQAQYLIPAAISLAYGVLFATLITLVLVPVLQAVGSDVLPAGGRSSNTGPS